MFAAQIGRIIWYRIGKLVHDTNPSYQVVNSAYVEWNGQKQVLAVSGNPTISLTNDNTVVVAYEKGLVYWETAYRIGDVQGDIIVWRSNSKILIDSQSTKHDSIAINNQGQMAIGYSRGYTRTIHYTSGKIETDEIVISETVYTPSGGNYHPMVSLNNEGHVLTVFHSFDGSLKLKINNGIIKLDEYTQNIHSNNTLSGQASSHMCLPPMDVIRQWQSMIIFIF